MKSIFENKIKNVSNPFLLDYYNELKDYFLSGGKRIRPLLCIATHNAFKNEKRDDIVLPSIGTEFLHNASLIHDDIIDKDDFRRGKPAFHYRFKQYHVNYKLKKMVADDFGTNIGILGGDSAYFLGMDAFYDNGFAAELNLNAINYYKKVFEELVNGVLIEVDMVNQKKLTIQDYIEMISLKTGALIEKSILIGASYARVEDKYLQHLSTYGINLGIIFQITDDILGTFGDEKKTGKPTDGDIKEGKKTCLLIEALNTLSVNKKERLLDLIEGQEITEDGIQEVKDLFIEADASDTSRKAAEKYFNEATDAIDKLNSIINSEEAEFFTNLLNFVMNRNF